MAQRQNLKIYKLKPEAFQEEGSTVLDQAVNVCGHQRHRQQKNRKTVLFLILFFKFYQTSEEAKHKTGGNTYT